MCSVKEVKATGGKVNVKKSAAQKIIVFSYIHKSILQMNMSTSKSK